MTKHMKRTLKNLLILFVVATAIFLIVRSAKASEQAFSRDEWVGNISLDEVTWKSLDQSGNIKPVTWDAPMAVKYSLQVVRTKKGQFMLRLVAPNGQTVMAGETLKNRDIALRTARRVAGGEITVKDLTGAAK